MRLDGPEALELSSLSEGDSSTLLSALSLNRAAFDPWLRWSASIRDEAAARAFVLGFVARERENRGFHLGLRRGTTLIGGVVCWSLDPIHQAAELGYWLIPTERGRGLIHRSVAIVVRHMFEILSVNRIEFLCRVDNLPSRRVAERLGAHLEGIRRESHWVDGAFQDHAVYSALAKDLRFPESSTG